MPRKDRDRLSAPLEAAGSPLRNTGIDPIGDAPWGTHFCQFYETEADLVDLLVPYFTAGLQNNEFCMWVTSEPLRAAEAETALRKALPELDDYIRKGQIEILDYSEWYTQGGAFDADRVLDGWVERERSAIEKGFDGLRLTGNTFWLEKSDWKSFADYEAKVNSVIGQYRMIALCSYALDKCGPHEFIDVVHNHQFALVKRDNQWEVLAASALQQARRALQEERTRGEGRWERTFDAVPDLIAIIDEDYRIVRANRALAHRLRLTPDQCVGKVCYEAVHELGCPPEFCPHSRTLADGREHVAEVHEPRLGGEFVVTTTPLLDEQGRRLGSVHVARDITERKQREDQLRYHAALLADLSDAVIATDKQWVITAWNPAAEALFGWKAEEVLGQPSAEILTRIERDGRPFRRDGSRRALADTGRLRAELTYYRKDGTQVEVESSAVAIHDDQGQPVGYVTVLRDITERKEAQEALQNLTTFPEENPNPVIRVANDGTVLFANQASRPLLDLWRCAVGASLPPEPYQQVERAVKAGNLINAETVCGDRTYLVICAPIAGRDYVNIYGLDITERKQAAGALRQTRDYLEKLIDYANAPIIVWDPSFTITRFNGAFERLTGRPASEVIGQLLEVLFPENERAASMEQIARAVGGEFWELIEIPILHRDGQVRQVLWNSANITGADGRSVVATIAQGTDITERKQAEEALRQSREDLKRAQAVAHVGNWYLDMRRNELLWSDEAYRIFGIPEETPLTYETFLAAVHPEDREYVDEKWTAALRGQPYDIEHRIVVGETVKWVHERAELEFQKDGTLLGGFGTVQDITELKQAEEALERLRSEFTGIVTHELKTPLTAIKGSAATALGSQRPLDAEDVRELFQIIDEQSDRLRELMDDLLDVTRIEAGILSVSPEPIGLPEVLEETRTTFVRSGGRHEVRLDVPADVPFVNADRRRLCQVLANLLNNAATFSSPIEPITISVEQDPLRVTVHVRDRGQGIPREKLPLLFKKFSRLHDDAGKKLSGTGLGLAICKGIVEAHGGRIWADSAGECQGSTFSFTLPVASETSVQSLTDEARRTVHRGRVRRAGEKTRVLAVDDEPQVLRLLRRSLDEAGYQPIVTADPADVAKLVELEEPDLILLDLRLPGTSGFELLRHIREFSGAPVIFLTASDREEDTVRALKMGADDYITKPFSPSELLARIEAALRRRVLPDVTEIRPPFVLGDLTMNFAERRVTVAGQPVSLSATEYKILYELANDAGRPLTYEQILHQVWGPEYSGETELVRSFIRNLRRKLGDDARDPRFILTERQVGYRMPKP